MLRYVFLLLVNCVFVCCRYGGANPMSLRGFVSSTFMEASRSASVLPVDIIQRVCALYRLC